jgi:hypothetical protein
VQQKCELCKLKSIDKVLAVPDVLRYQRQKKYVKCDKKECFYNAEPFCEERKGKKQKKKQRKERR